MDLSIYLVAAIFLPLFPFSMLFNAVYGRVRHVGARIALLLLWPQIGLLLVGVTDEQAPRWITYWAVLTSLLYAFRMLAVREVSIWVGFLGASAWALLWLHSVGDGGGATGSWLAFGLSLPLVLMASLVVALENRLGGAYAGLRNDLARTAPRLAGVLVVAILAVIATPPFPGFFTLLVVLIHILPEQPSAAIGLIGVWVLWSWAGARLIQGLVVGPASANDVVDLSRASAWNYAAALVAFVIGGISVVGSRL